MKKKAYKSSLKDALLERIAWPLVFGMGALAVVFGIGFYAYQQGKKACGAVAGLFGRSGGAAEEAEAARSADFEGASSLSAASLDDFSRSAARTAPAPGAAAYSGPRSNPLIY